VWGSSSPLASFITPAPELQMEVKQVKAKVVIDKGEVQGIELTAESDDDERDLTQFWNSGLKTDKLHDMQVKSLIYRGTSEHTDDEEVKHDQ